MKAAFEGPPRRCHVVAGTTSDQEIVLTRLAAGYVLACSGLGASRLARYQEADDEGHPLHLIGNVPDSDAGRASQSYRILSPHRILSPKEPTDEHDGDSQ